jgi:D-alanyl-D-alanine carboxypeptidase/D-alanyl-D-alanine-endopeptidase (penicillin-binding protein 4)
MKSILSKIIIVSCFSCIATAQANTKTLSRKLNNAVNRFDSHLNIGISVKSLTNNKLLYEKNANRSFTPASSLKLLIGAASLTELGPYFVYKTLIKINSKHLKNHILNGNLYIKFSGDPSLTSQDLVILFEKLYKYGVHQIKGDIILDNYNLYDKNYGPGWMWDEMNACYSPSINALALNRNCFTLYITPGHTTKFPPKITYNKFEPHILIQNKLSTEKTDNKCKVTLESNKNNNYILTGCLNHGASTKILKISVRNTAAYMSSQLHSILSQLHIKFSGKIYSGNSPSNLRTNFKHHSKSLSYLLSEMLKDSNNLYAESIMMTLASHHFNKPPTWKSGVKAIKEILTKNYSLSFDKTRMVDASGLSRYNLTTPHMITKLLTGIYQNKKIFPFFKNSLSIAFVDGTLVDRLYHYKGKVFAKTGTMSGVTAIAGYILKKSHTYTFSVMMNNYVGSSKHYKKLEDKIISIISSASNK